MAEHQKEITTELSSVGHDSVEQFAFEVLQDSLKSVRKSLGRAAKLWEKNPEYIHHLRVSGRRALAAIGLFAELIPASDAKWFRKTLKSIHAAAGKARDLDVFVHDQLPHCGHAARKLGRVWRKQRTECQKPIVRLSKKLRKRDGLKYHIRTLIESQERATASECTANVVSCGQWAESRILDHSRRFFAAIPADADAQALHSLRIRTKQFRYTIELLQPALESMSEAQCPSVPPSTESLISSHGGEPLVSRQPFGSDLGRSADVRISEALTHLEQLQKQLGALQDDVVARERFQKSLKYLDKSPDQKNIRRLIEKADGKIAKRIEHLRFWSESDACQQFRSCFEPG